MTPGRSPGVVRTVIGLRRRVAAWRSRGFEVVFVPTMGALHDGHRQLIERAGGPRRRVVVSIFVNPTQFGPDEDFSRYPRELHRDVLVCSRAGAHLVFAPPVATIYPDGFATRVHVEGLDSTLCGPRRPGHFDGVATVVLKLLNLVAPDRLVLGQKDAQQAVIVGRMMRDLDLPIALDIAPTVREKDGLAFSSRNRYLSAAERRAAPALYRSLQEARRLVRSGERRSSAIRRRIGAILSVEPLLEPEYVEIVDATTLRGQIRISGRVIIALAVQLGRARLIDNIMLTVPQTRGGKNT